MLGRVGCVVGRLSSSSFSFYGGVAFGLHLLPRPCSARAGKPREKPQAHTRNEPSSKRPARPRSGRARASSDRVGLLFGCSRCSCRSCLAARPGARALAVAVLAALAALVLLGVLAALDAIALPVLRWPGFCFECFFALEAGQEAPERRQEAPRGREGAPRAAQEAPRERQEAPRRV